jgi:hypothetical protein
MYVKKGYMRFEKSKNFLLITNRLRDLCVRWSFGRCFKKCARVFIVVPYHVPLVDCRLANLEGN